VYNNHYQQRLQGFTDLGQKKENVKLDVCLCRPKSDTKGRMKQGEIKEENERIFFVFFHFAFCSVLLLFF